MVNECTEPFHHVEFEERKHHVASFSGHECVLRDPIGLLASLGLQYATRRARSVPSRHTSRVVGTLPCHSVARPNLRVYTSLSYLNL